MLVIILKCVVLWDVSWSIVVSFALKMEGILNSSLAVLTGCRVIFFGVLKPCFQLSIPVLKPIFRKFLIGFGKIMLNHISWIVMVIIISLPRRKNPLVPKMHSWLMLNNDVKLIELGCCLRLEAKALPV